MFSKLSLAALVGAVTLAASAASAPPAAKPAAVEPKNDVVCTSEQSTGSHLPKRNCMTRAAREERAKRDQEAMRNLHDQNKKLGSGQ